MKCEPSAIPEVLLLEPELHEDERGFFLESYQAARYAALGLPPVFVQDNHSGS
ncbi:MAG TPA: dTDP-4-dehydrorhamnose 3,5-epimerase family protein, partial [Anaerolineales bacterium]|nr:dTDP-4-dehydrorhamnose 3,5-epimerase family protein [Anaerolineales bacterium]